MKGFSLAVSRSVRFSSFFLKCSSSSDELACCILRASCRFQQDLSHDTMEHKGQVHQFCSRCTQDMPVRQRLYLDLCHDTTTCCKIMHGVQHERRVGTHMRT